MVSHRSKHIAPKTWLSRREFLKLAAFGLGSLSVGLPSVGAPTLRPWSDLQALPDFPLAERLGRVAVGMVDLKMRPDPESPTLGVLYEDAVIAWLREAAGARPNPIFNSQRWVETPKGYIYSPYLQPVYNHPNQPVDTLPTSTRGPGMWVEVTVPYAEAALDKDEPSSNSWAEVKIEQGLPLRVYYGQTFWVDQIRADSQGKALYRINPNYYGGVDMLWAAAEAFRPITTDDLRPIHPDAVDKRIVVDVTHQTLSCFEGQSEVYFCQVSTGAKYDMYGNPVDEWATPLGHHIVERKYISLQMSGGTTGAGYDLPGIAWTNVFAIGGVAIHATFWHHNYGTPVSHGCVNCTPEDALWIFRWTVPEVVYDPGMVDVTVTGQESTSVDVIEA
jgi:lipoprotein-anchoring transpeptidase ErfK/SrfK